MYVCVCASVSSQGVWGFDELPVSPVVPPSSLFPPFANLMTRTSARASACARPSVLWTLEAIRLIPNERTECCQP